MSFSFYSPTKHKASLPRCSEPNSIGCEAWIDVNRFCDAEQSVHKPAETSCNGSLTKSFSDLCRKLHRGWDEVIG
jgi:hypothetical protein